MGIVIFNINGARWWLYVASTPTLTAYHLHRSRGRTAVTAVDVLPAFRGTVVHDALSVYDTWPADLNGYSDRHDRTPDRHSSPHLPDLRHSGREYVVVASKGGAEEDPARPSGPRW